MKVISSICGFLVAGLIIAILILLITLIIRFLSKKPCKPLGRVVLYCIGGILAFTIAGVLTDPATWCEHEYSVEEEVAPTCTEKGKVVKRCPLCEREVTEYPDMLSHSWGEEVTKDATCTEKGYTKKVCSVCSTEEIDYIDELPHQWVVKTTFDATCTEKGKFERVCAGCSTEETVYSDVLPHSWSTDSVVNATCTNEGYTLEKCSGCLATQRTNITKALGHSMRETSRTEPMVGVEGKIVKKCDRCNHEEVESIDKLEPITIKFDGLELVFGQYSFAEVDNKYSEYYEQTVVKIPVTIKNTSNEPNSLYYFYYKLFGVSGVESPDVYYYFDDDVSQGGDLLPGISYTKYFHILYDGDGEYTIVFDDLLFEKKTVKITVKK